MANNCKQLVFSPNPFQSKVKRYGVCKLSRSTKPNGLKHGNERFSHNYAPITSPALSFSILSAIFKASITSWISPSIKAGRLKLLKPIR